MRAVRQSPSQDLKLPIQVGRGGSFGFPAVAVQAIATWARLHEGSRQLQLNPSFHSEASTRERFAGGLMGMCALYFAHQVKSGSTVLPRGKALESVAPRVVAMDQYRYRDTQRGRAAALCCFEGARLEFLRSLYAMPARGSAENTTVRSSSEFGEIFSDLIEATSAGSSKMLSPMQLEVVGSLVHQLFKNADVHTMTDSEGHLYDSGVRGLQLREVVIADDAALNDYVAGDRAFLSYLTKLGNRQQTRSKSADGGKRLDVSWKATSFLEVTVFDTGPGLALRWLSQKGAGTRYADVSRDDEFKAVLECFRLHATTHSAPNRGDGLAIALEAMRELRAFMFLRTGRLALYQDFTSKAHETFSPSPRYGGKGLLAEAAGASYSICFPVAR